MVHDVADARRVYARAGLAEADLAADWLTQLRRWLDDARASGMVEPSAMVLSTVDADGTPSSRTVLCKGLDERGIAFYTHRTSRKGAALEATGVAALTFPWVALERQVCVVGNATAVDDAEADTYFSTRPRGSQLGAWASQQSQVTASREGLEQRLADADARFADAEVPRPPTWGGFRVAPTSVEFWQGRPNRLHDRLRYRATAGGWVIERLDP